MYAIGVGSSANPHPHRTITIYITLAIFAAIFGIINGGVLAVTRDMGWWPMVAAWFVICAGLLGQAVTKQAEHHDDMETTLLVISNIAASHLRARRHLEGEDPIRAWHELAKEVNQELRSMGK